MARFAQFPARFDVLEDMSLASGCESSDQSSIDLGDTRPAPLRDIAVPSAQNRQARQVDSLAVEFRRLHIGEPHQLDQYKGKPVPSTGARPQSGSRSTHPRPGALETVPEDENQIASKPPAVSVSAKDQSYIELSAGEYSQHPLAIAARRLPSAEQQLTKHRNGDFEWVLTVTVPTSSAACKDREPASVSKVFFGCNLFPSEAQPNTTDDSNESAEAVYRLLVTPLQPTAELEAATEPNYKARNMETALPTGGDPTPVVAPAAQPEVQPEAQPEATAVDMSASSSTTSEDCDSLADNMTSRSPATTVARIEDSVDELDKLEEQLEAFNLAASPASLAAPPDLDKRPATSLARSPSNNASRSPHSTPQPKRVSLLGSPLDTKRSPSYRPPTYRSPRNRNSMVLLDSPKLKVEEKALAQAPPKRPANKGVASLQQPKPLARSSKPPTIPSFELPGEAVARRLKEQRQARLSMIATREEPQPATPIRKSKSARAPTRPTFELPGEAISRRKRQEHEARLKAQEEEERKRREFKARPVPTGRAAFSSVPRDTATSRARQGKPLLSENGDQSPFMTSKRSSLVMTRDPLSSSSNQPRGRDVADDAAGRSRAASSSNGSTSGKRSSISLEDVQQQRRRGQEILKRDSLLAKGREREKREREALARLAREQAAERSRQLSREWAEKQKRKRMTVGSLGDVVTPTM